MRLFMCGKLLFPPKNGKKWQIEMNHDEINRDEYNIISRTFLLTEKLIKIKMKK